VFDLIYGLILVEHQLEFWVLCLNLIQCVPGFLFRGVNQLECEVDRSLHSSAAVKNEWTAYTPDSVALVIAC
jgi:hypothetical protein